MTVLIYYKREERERRLLRSNFGRNPANKTDDWAVGHKSSCCSNPWCGSSQPNSGLSTLQRQPRLVKARSPLTPPPPKVQVPMRGRRHRSLLFLSSDALGCSSALWVPVVTNHLPTWSLFCRNSTLGGHSGGFREGVSSCMRQTSHSCPNNRAVIQFTHLM